ncbi:Rv3235 family protein [Arthrobacter dokdonensis]|uniref:Rv3235 family protein n=1 Tax=Arthrobacter dokdonellae TaxID=2211210 RepID=UPI000DE5AB9C|nr:Rv3235 family protein [Arthrobacter dokdonellae]
MNIRAIEETAPASAKLVARPAPALQGTGRDSGSGTEGAVVKMTPRPGRGTAAQGRTDLHRSGADLHSGTSAHGGATVLDPRAPERALVAEMSRRIAQAALEVLSGVRSVQQLSRWLDTRCFSALTTRARLHAAACQAESRHRSETGHGGNVSVLHHQPIVHSTHCSAIAPGIYETSVVVADKARFRAIAMRFEETRGTWKVTALQIG